MQWPSGSLVPSRSDFHVRSTVLFSPLAGEEQVTVLSQAALRTPGCSKSKWFQYQACRFCKCMHSLCTLLAAVPLEWRLRFDSFGCHALRWFVLV